MKYQIEFDNTDAYAVTGEQDILQWNQMFIVVDESQVKTYIEALTGLNMPPKSVTIVED